MHYKSHATAQIKALSENKGVSVEQLDPLSLTCSTVVDLLSQLRPTLPAGAIKPKSLSSSNGEGGEGKTDCLVRAQKINTSYGVQPRALPIEAALSSIASLDTPRSLAFIRTRRKTTSIAGHSSRRRRFPLVTCTSLWYIDQLNRSTNVTPKCSGVL